MPKDAKETKEKKVSKITIRGVDVKKAMISKGVFAGILGFLLGVAIAIGVVQIPFVGVIGAIGIIIITPAIAAVFGAILGGICAIALNLALQTSDGFDIEYN